MLPRIHALIPAAGQSVRFGGTTRKQYAHLLGRPVIAHSMEALLAHPAVQALTVALAPDDGIYDELLRPQYPAVDTVMGGDCRAQTVLNGLKFIRARDPGCDWVLVHDAARPCLSRSNLDQLLHEGLASGSGAILAVPVSDTLKQSTADGFSAGTIDRSSLWTAQTPQLFPLDALLLNLGAALTFGRTPTDEAEAMERAGTLPRLVPGSSGNIKITGPEDLALAEGILRRRATNGGSQ